MFFQSYDYKCTATLLDRVSVCTAKVAYSHRHFPLTICWSVRRYICLSSALRKKTADRIRMPFGMVGWTGPWMRQVMGFGDRSTGEFILEANMGRPIVTNGGLFTIGNYRYFLTLMFPKVV